MSREAGDTHERSLAHWSEARRAEMDAFYRVATLDYRELARELKGRIVGVLARAACAVGATLGAGVGGFALTARLDAVEPGREAELRRWLEGECLPAAHAAPGVVGAHLCIADEGASTIETAEKRGRAGRDRVPGWTVVVEASSDDALAEIRDRFGDAAWVERAGGAAEVGVYRLDYLLAGG